MRATLGIRACWYYKTYYAGWSSCAAFCPSYRPALPISLQTRPVAWRLIPTLITIQTRPVLACPTLLLFKPPSSNTINKIADTSLNHAWYPFNSTSYSVFPYCLRPILPAPPLRSLYSLVTYNLFGLPPHPSLSLSSDITPSIHLPQSPHVSCSSLPLHSRLSSTVSPPL